MWKEKICGKSFGSYNFLNDSTPNNASFTVFSPHQFKEGGFIRNDFFYIQKSCLLDLFIIYVKSSIIVKYDDGDIRYPTTLIVSPISIYKDFFYKSTQLIIKKYPNAIFMTIPMTGWEINIDLPFINYSPVTYYEVLFGYEGDILKYDKQGDAYFDHLKWYSENNNI